MLKIMEMNFVGWASSITRIALNAPEQPSLAHELKTSFTSRDAQILRQFAEVAFFSDHRQELAKVTAPTLIFQSSEDSVVPLEVAQYLHRQLANSTLHISAARGHYPHITNPQGTASIIKQYLRHHAANCLRLATVSKQC